MEDFDSGLSLQIDVLTKVDLSEASASQEADQAVIAKLLSNPIYHTARSPHQTANPSLPLIIRDFTFPAKVRSLGGSQMRLDKVIVKKLAGCTLYFITRPQGGLAI